MRITRYLVPLLFPVPLLAQYPDPGTYKGKAQFVAQDQSVALLLEIERAADSTVVRIRQEGQDPIPLSTKLLTSGGFTIGFGNLTCPFVIANDQWEAVCSDTFDTPQFTLIFPRRPESSPPGA
jgi:hypothetical protein